MTEIECGSCGTEFDTDRDTGDVYKNPRRCPYCGTVAEVEGEPEAPAPAPDGADDRNEEIVARGGTTTVRITIEIDPEPAP